MKNIKKIENADEDEFLKDLQFIYNQWDEVEILDLNWEYKSYRAILLCKDNQKWKETQE